MTRNRINIHKNRKPETRAVQLITRKKDRKTLAKVRTEHSISISQKVVLQLSHWSHYHLTLIINTALLKESTTELNFAIKNF